MNDLELHGSDRNRLPSREQREFDRAGARIVAETKLAATAVDAEAALTGRIMERLVDIDDYRGTLSGTNETRNAILTRLEMVYVSKMERRLRDFGSELGL